MAVSRTQFDETIQVVKKIFQKGTPLMDADLNESIDVQDNYNRRFLSGILGHVSKRFSDGFKVVGTGASLQVTIKAGIAGFEVDTDKNILLRLASDYTLSGFTTWSGARTDYVYIDIEEVEVTSATDPDLINPEVGVPTAVDIRYSYTLEISEGSAPSSPPADHTYVTLATITKTSGSNILSDDVTVTISDVVTLDGINLIDDSVVTAKLDDLAVTTAKIANDAVDTLQLTDLAVSTAKMDDSAVNEDKIDNLAVTTGKIDNLAVTTGKIGALAVQTAKIDNDSVTKEKINADIAGNGMAQQAGGEFDVDGIVEQDSDVEIKVKIIEIGDWDMDIDSIVYLNTDIPTSKIRSFSAIVRDDDGDSGNRYPIDYSPDQTAIAGYYRLINNAGFAQIQLMRMDSLFFDSTTFDTPTSYNRGWVMIWYSV